MEKREYTHMTDQERQLLEELAGRIQRAPSPQIDREADDIIRRGIGVRPDALYILTQTVLIQEMALNQAKQQIDDLRRQQPPQPFLPPQPSPQPAPQAQSQPGGGFRSSSYQTAATPPPLPAQQYAPPQYAAPQYEYAPQPTGFSGFLRNAAQTAAGVVAGEVAFSALSSMFGGHRDHYYGGGYGGGGGFFEGGGVSNVSETIINNNYYEDNRSVENNTTENDTYQAADSTDNSSDDSYDDSSSDDSSSSDSDDV